MNKKAYAFPTSELINYGPIAYISGICVDEDGNMLGGWTSSSISFLKSDLMKHAGGYEYSFSEEMPEFIRDKLQKRVWIES